MDTPTTPPIDLGAIEATLLDALEAVDRQAEAFRKLSTCSGPSPELDAAMEAERVVCGAWFAALAAWREAGYPRPLTAIRAYLDAVVTQPGRDDFPEWHALADEDRDRLQAWGDRVCQAGMDAENEATEEAEDAARHAAEQADILLTTIRLALGDNPAGNGWKPPTGVHPVVDLALTVSGERDEARTALATARLDGARAMREAAASILDDCAAEHYRTDEDDLHDLITALGRDVRRLDPAAVVGSGS